MNELAAVSSIERRIYRIRGKQVMLDFDLARLYGVAVLQLKRQVRRNIDRFPADFMFTLDPAEHTALRCQIGILERGRHSKFLPFAFTEQGIAMLSGLLRSPQAVKVNIAIMRAFVRLRRLLMEDRGLGALVAEHERRLDGHDQDIAGLLETIPQLPEPKPVNGFSPPDATKPSTGTPKK